MTRKTQEAQSLTPITAVLQERAFHLHRQRRAETARIDGEIAEIDRLRQTAAACAAGLDAGRMIGADILWSDWILQRRADLLRHAAMARAHQAESHARARKAFARHEAAMSLVAAALAEDRSRRQAKQAESLQEMMILKAGFGDRTTG